MKSRASQTWTGESAAALTLRYLARELSAKGLPASYWVPAHHRG
eukprot:gene6709-biopygen11939